MTAIPSTPTTSLIPHLILPPTSRAWNKFDGMVLDRIIVNLVDAKMLRSYTRQAKEGRDVVYELLTTKRFN